jgi:hypothetical protein
VSKTVTDRPTLPVAETVTTAPVMDTGTTIDISGEPGLFLVRAERGNPERSEGRASRSEILIFLGPPA